MQPYIYNSIEPVCKITLTALKQYHLFIFAVLVVWHPYSRPYRYL